MSKKKGNRERQRTGEQREAVRQETQEKQETAQDKAQSQQRTAQDRKKELERLILEYTEELAEDINLRLLAQQDLEPAGWKRGRCHTGKVLYVESIIVTDIRYPEKKRGSSFKELGNNVKNILKRR